MRADLAEGEAASDADILRRRLLLVDCDPRREKETSATAAELKQAEEMAVAIRQFLRTRGWPDPVSARSGNGGHLLYLIELSNDDDAERLVHDVLLALARRFDTPAVEVDVKVANASRICKLYGTMARKGDDTPERPHRRSKVFKVPEPFRAVPRELLEALAAEVREEPRAAGNGRSKAKAKPSSNGQHRRRGELTDEDQELLALARIDKNGERFQALYDRGDWKGAGYDSHSQADQGLVNHLTFYFAPDPVAIDRAFYWSKLMRPKWDEVHYKDGDTYGERTIATAIRDATEFYSRTAQTGREGAYDVNDVGRKDVKGVISDAEWPQPPGREAFAGLAGEAVRLVEPVTEADPVALLLQVLVGFGSILGRQVYATADGVRHHGNLFALNIGASSRARKGTSWNRARAFLEPADPGWARDRIASGLSTGEGLIHEVRDPIVNRKGEIEDEGVADKRLLVVEGEFGKVLRVLKREHNTLSSVLRLAYDGSNLRSMVKGSPARATDPHISLIGHITREELLTYLDNVEIFNGLGNRILPACVRRSKILPRGGTIDDLKVHKLARKIADRVASARAVGFYGRTDAFWEHWDQGGIYERLTEDRAGLWGVITARAEANVLRLALLYAALDGARMIDLPHLESALALWRFCDDSAGYLFGKTTADPAANKILKALRASENGLTRDEIYRSVFAKNASKETIERALATLLKARLAYPLTTQTEGRPVEAWYVGTP